MFPECDTHVSASAQEPSVAHHLVPSILLDVPGVAGLWENPLGSPFSSDPY